MTSRTRRALRAAVTTLVVGTFAVGGGATAAFGSTPSAATGGDSPAVHLQPVKVSTAKLKRVDTIELDAESIVFRRDGKTVVETSMRDSRGTVGVLNRLLGTPSRTKTPEGDGGACFPSGTTYTWGGAVRVAALSTPAEIGNAVEVRVLRDVVRSRFGDPVELTGPDGVQVGDDLHDVIAAAPRSDRMSFGTGDDAAWQVVLQEGWQPTDDAPDEGDAAGGDTADALGTNGVSALTDRTTVTVLGSPMPVHAQRGC